MTRNIGICVYRRPFTRRTLITRKKLLSGDFMHGTQNALRHTIQSTHSAHLRTVQSVDFVICKMDYVIFIPCRTHTNKM